MSFIRFRHAMLIAAVCVLMNSVALAAPGWFWQNPLPQGNPLSGVAVPNANTVVAVGAAGTILKSIDGGANWMLQSSGTTNGLSGVSCTDASNCTAVGDLGTVLQGNNGGPGGRPKINKNKNCLYGGSCTDAKTRKDGGERET